MQFLWFWWCGRVVEVVDGHYGKLVGAGQILWATKKRARARKKSVLLISLYLGNYSSNYEILKSLTQLCKWAT
jgi:hypothetical protein